MKIIANRKEDILRRKAEYEADAERRRKQVEEEEHNFHVAELAVTDPVKQEIEKLFSKYPTLNARVTVERAPFRQPGLRVRIEVNEREKFEDSSALSWEYDVYLTEDGEVKRETNSWSGMKAVTGDQLKNLEETVAVLKELLDMNWKNLLDKTLPSYKDYLKTDDPRYDRNKPDFDRELMEAEIEDIIGQRKMIKVKEFPSSWYGRDHYIAILRDSGTQYTIKECPMYAYENGEATKIFDQGESHRVKKSQIVPVKPFDIIDV